MTRSVGHLLLILVVLACPVQCVISGDLCCVPPTADSVVESSAESTTHCVASHSCCHHVVNDDEPQVAVNDLPTHVPHSDTTCERDCLCKGAIAASVQVAEDISASSLDVLDACRVICLDVSRTVDTLQSGPPDPSSGREIRTLRMSFQV